MSRTREEILEAHKRLKAEYRELYNLVLALLFRHDPIGINFDANTDEYAPEVETILPRLRSCHSANEVQQVVHEEFERWFGVGTAGPPENYTKIATEIWEHWKKFNPT